MFSHRQRFTIFATLSVLVFGMAVPQSAAGQDRTIKIAVEGYFPPFNYLDANDQLQGFDVDIAEALCTAMQAKCHFVVQDWDEMIPGLLAKQYDAIISSMSINAERQQLVAFSDRYYDSPSVFLTTKDAAFSVTEINSKKLGVAVSTSQEAYIRQFYPDSTVILFKSSPELYEALANGEVDAIFEDKLAAYDWLTNTKAGQCCEFRSDDIKNAAYLGNGAGIALRKEDVELLAAFDAALAEITEKGTYNTINAAYFPFSIR
jgi:polar amino acid transport system substrate-binding protein